MRHRIKGRKLGRSTSHRLATLRSLATALIKHKKIKTTLAKAKQTRLFVEPLITKAKNGSVHSRRLVASQIHDKEVVKELFGEVAEKIGDRPGGYTRIVKLGNRVGDGAEMAIIELVDYNNVGSKKTNKPKKKTEPKNTEKVEEAKVEEIVEDTTEIDDKKTEEIKTEVEEAVTDENKEDTKPDDLKKIEGIGPKIAEILNTNGIKTFSDLAATEADKIREMLKEAGGRFASHNPETWPAQAKLAADGKWDELKKWQDELDGGIDKA